MSAEAQWDYNKLTSLLSREDTIKTADTYVRARIDSATKQRAADTLAAMGLSISDAIRLLMFRVVDEHRLPFEVRAPNATTRKAIAQLEAGKGRRFKTTAALMADLNEDDLNVLPRSNATTGVRRRRRVMPKISTRCCRPSWRYFSTIG